MHRLNQIMECIGINAKELSQLCGLHFKSIERHCRGEAINRDSLVEYTKIFQLPMEYILGEENNRTGKYDIEDRMLNCPELFKARFDSYNKEVINEDKSYYMIFERNHGDIIEQEAYTVWKSDTEDGEYEIRIPRLLNHPKRERHEKIYGSLMIINKEVEAAAMSFFGGAALVEKDICESWFPEYFERGIHVEKQEYIIM